MRENKDLQIKFEETDTNGDLLEVRVYTKMKCSYYKVKQILVKNVLKNKWILLEN